MSSSRTSDQFREGVVVVVVVVVLCVVCERERERETRDERERSQNYFITQGLRFYAVACSYNLSLLSYIDNTYEDN